MKKMIFFNIGWMKDYKGLTSGDDSIVGGGSFVQEHGYGYEIFNFLSYNEYRYGCVSVRGSINIGKLGGSKNDTSVDDVLAVWVSKSPLGGVFVVGWYDKATVYNRMQAAPKGSKREYKGEELGYYVKAKVEDCTLLPVDNRVLKIPRKVKGGMGQSNIWYADDPLQASFREDVLNFINTGKISKSKQPQQKDGKSWQPDPYKRQKVEQVAIKLTVEHYENLGYTVDSVEKDNVGWDLEATLYDKLLRLEVKGLSQKELLIELTPNEYASMKKYRDSYRICAVTEALGNIPLLRIFSFSPENEKWEDDEGNQLKIGEIVSARMSIL